jgi:hypothetical protein
MQVSRKIIQQGSLGIEMQHVQGISYSAIMLTIHIRPPENTLTRYPSMVYATAYKNVPIQRCRIFVEYDFEVDNCMSDVVARFIIAFNFCRYVIQQKTLFSSG